MKKPPIFKTSRASRVEGPTKSTGGNRWVPRAAARRLSWNLNPGPWTLLAAGLLGAILLLGPWAMLRAPYAAAEQTDQNREQPAQDEEAQQDLPAPETLLPRVRDQLQEYRPMKAGLVERVVIGDRRFKAEGNYLHGANLKLRLEMRIRLGDAEVGLEGSLLQVCDGDILWTRHKVGDEVQINRRDVREILRAAREAGDIPNNVLVADLGLGGVPAVLASLERTMTFDTIRKERVGETPLLMIEGTWNQRYLDRLQSLGQVRADAGAEQLSPPRLPQHFPEKVRIYLDPETLFPRRIQYLKRPPERTVFRPMVTLDFLDIVLNASVNEEEFLFVAGPDAPQQVDVTNQYIQLLQQGQPGTGDQATPPETTTPETGLPSGNAIPSP